MKNPIKYLARRGIKAATPYIRDCLQALEDADSSARDIPVDNTYQWLAQAFTELMRDPVAARRPEYAWGVAQGAALAKVLDLGRISVLEFGVAGGFGLLCLERCAVLVEAKTEVEIEVYGFDSGVGLPKPIDYRDQPNMWLEGQLPMNRQELERKLGKATLKIGFLNSTIADFSAEHPAPVAFVSIDVDLYRSTLDAFTIFTGDYSSLLPRIMCYFDDISGHSYSDFTGERLAISEFNDGHATRKICPVYNMRYFVPKRYRSHLGWQGMYFAHFFEHPLYNRPDSLRKAVYVDANGRVSRDDINSNWQSRLSGS